MGRSVSYPSGAIVAFTVLEVEAEDDWEFEFEGVKLLVDPMTFPMIDNVTVDFIETLTHTGFRFDNPNASAKCACGSSFSV